ncbi:hypothetical protein [Arenimonas fontis]|uniref:Uncharacterized protein n=1 Tax=Arenimonas fontis TaxID=2608255 RepID=A0A5B2Z7V1_9GAMM|nr:hypothetical protein [Arenimonas fontis]KAA2284049.1 hypothetical protein F0415_11190 [Arenimonas fontis]
MYWIYLLLSVLCLALAMSRGISTALSFLFLLGAFGFMLAWVVGWLQARIASRSRDVSHILSPDELRRIRERAEARKSPGDGGTPPDGPAT